MRATRLFRISSTKSSLGFAPIQWQRRHRTDATSSYIHITGLPETPYVNLVGRDAELARLDAAWADPVINIISLVAEGGAGKSALVNEWLNRLRADNYRGAAMVLGWSFYSQGTKERVTSSDGFLDWAVAKLDIKLDGTSATQKAEKIAEALMRRRVLLVLDGVEPLQYGPGPQPGQLKDQGLRTLLRHFAAAPPAATHGLLVLTSRLAVADLARWRDSAAPVVDVEHLSDAAGAALLRDNQSGAPTASCRQPRTISAATPWHCNCLPACSTRRRNGDVRRRDEIEALLADPDNPRHDHARRVPQIFSEKGMAGRGSPIAGDHAYGRPV